MLYSYWMPAASCRLFCSASTSFCRYSLEYPTCIKGYVSGLIAVAMFIFTISLLIDAQEVTDNHCAGHILMC